MALQSLLDVFQPFNRVCVGADGKKKKKKKNIRKGLQILRHDSIIPKDSSYSLISINKTLKTSL